MSPLASTTGYRGTSIRPLVSTIACATVHPSSPQARQCSMESPALAVVSEDQRSLPGGKRLALPVFSPNSFPNGEATLSAYYPTAGAQPGSSLQAMLWSAIQDSGRSVVRVTSL